MGKAKFACALLCSAQFGAQSQGQLAQHSVICVLALRY